MEKLVKDRLIIVATIIVSSLLFWLPFILRISSLPGWGIDFSGGMEKVFANFDGPNYLIIAKTWYNPDAIRAAFSSPLPLEYYPAHFPLYPATIALLNTFLPGTWAMLVSTQIGLVLAGLAFYELLRSFKLKNPLWLTMVFLFFPARFVTVAHIGSPEPWFIFFILTSLYFFNKKNYYLAGFAGALAQLTKSPGILLLLGYGIYFLYQWQQTKKFELKEYLKALPLGLIALVVPMLFWFYKLQTGDFWAYFNSGDNFHLFLPPFSIFAPRGQFWVGDFWLEDVIWIWTIYSLGVFNLWKRGFKTLASFGMTFLTATLMVAHRDVARYILPITGLTIMGLGEVIDSRVFKVIFAILLIPITLYSWNFILNNTSPIADWAPYL